MVSGRELALKILNEIDNEGAYSTLSVKKALDDNDRKDAGFIRELVYGVLKNQRLIDEIIIESSSIRMKKIHPMILLILRIGIYQIIFMDTIPESAAVDEAVKLAKKYGHKGTIGFVNGILRGIASRKTFFMNEDYKSGDHDLGIKFSHPDYMVRLWIEQYGLDFTRDLLKSNNKVPPFTIRTNTLKVSTKDLMHRLESYGFETVKGSIARDSIIVTNPKAMTNLPEFKEGLFTIQDEASMIVTEVINPTAGSFVIDVCSAPGGKSTHIAQWTGDNGAVIARDIYPHKLILVDGLAKRLGIKTIKTELWDALKIDDGLLNKADYCLVDAPCSGLGLIRRKPDIKWTRSRDDIRELSLIQSRILTAASGYVKPGGTLVYSTCTINKEENIDIIRKFLFANKDFELQPIVLSTGKVISKSQSEGFLELYPSIHGTDGFFIAKLVRAV